MSLWVPPKVTREMREERCAYTASLESMIDRLRTVTVEFTQKLREIDPRLELIFVPPNASAPGLVPGRYMVMRANVDGPPSLMVVEGPNGEFVEPGSRLLDDLRAQDMWSPEAMRDREERKRRREEDKERERLREQEARHAELEERWAAVTRTFVSMDRSTPWSQNVKGRKGVRRG